MPTRSTTAMWGSVLALMLVGLSVFVIAVLVVDVEVRKAGAAGRAGYCSVPGNTAADGTALQPGTFLDLLIGEPTTNGHYTGAAPANFIEGIGLSCGSPPAGYVRHGIATGAGLEGAGIYPFYAAPDR